MRRLARAAAWVAALLVLLCMPAMVRAQAFNFTLDPNTLSGSTGQTITFVGLLENTLGSTVEFTGMDLNLDGFDPTDYWDVFDYEDLADGSSRTSDMFSVYLSPSVGTGTYYGSALLYYKYNGGADTGSETQNFRLDVTNNNVIPEIALVQLPLLMGLGLLAWRRRRSIR